MNLPAKIGIIGQFMLTKKISPKFFLYLALAQSIVATLGSLFFSEVMKWTPCVLCWYQRILMYPLIAIITVGIVRKDKGLPYYVLPLSILGWLIALYHNLLYYHILPESTAPCLLNVSCTTRYFVWFGFLSIPLLSFIAFSVINVAMIMYLQKTRRSV